MTHKPVFVVDLHSILITMSNIKIHPISIKSNDLPSATVLEQIIALDRLCFGGLWSVDSYQRELVSENSHFLAVTADSGLEANMDAIVGFGCFWSILDEAHITLLGIHPEYQGRGLGQLLLCSLLDRARAIEMKRATLEVRASNDRAIHLYEKHGFTVVGRRKKYYQDNDEDGVIMWRGGLQHPYFRAEGLGVSG
jgi:[ribosomal protein S18]-alanine N-acetyltransferase